MSEATTTQRFTDNGDDTVTDNTTGLVWTKKTVAEDVTHEQAVAAVAALGEGFRLPTVQELFGLVDHTTCRPAIDGEAFPDTRCDIYWTSTPWAANPDAAVWCVDFGYGFVLDCHRDFDGCVRAVRPGQ
ncbi:MAG: DUF1566 domain-containing protein [Verrucomicrobiota bacterium JB024]|nr:DUF1566 domain-containing protein [Verrucomicrobiota bacterium JB024]